MSLHTKAHSWGDSRIQTHLGPRAEWGSTRHPERGQEHAHVRIPVHNRQMLLSLDPLTLCPWRGHLLPGCSACGPVALLWESSSAGSPTPSVLTGFDFCPAQAEDPAKAATVMGLALHQPRSGDGLLASRAPRWHMASPGKTRGARVHACGLCPLPSMPPGPHHP